MIIIVLMCKVLNFNFDQSRNNTCCLIGGQWSSDRNNCPTLLRNPVWFGAFFNIFFGLFEFKLLVGSDNFVGGSSNLDAIAHTIELKNI